jgi:hypothetical protein
VPSQRAGAGYAVTDEQSCLHKRQVWRRYCQMRANSPGSRPHPGQGCWRAGPASGGCAGARPGPQTTMRAGGGSRRRTARTSGRAGTRVVLSAKMRAWRPADQKYKQEGEMPRWSASHAAAPALQTHAPSLSPKALARTCRVLKTSKSEGRPRSCMGNRRRAHGARGCIFGAMRAVAAHVGPAHGERSHARTSCWPTRGGQDCAEPSKQAVESPHRLNPNGLRAEAARSGGPSPLRCRGCPCVLASPPNKP